MTSLTNLSGRNRTLAAIGITAVLLLIGGFFISLMTGWLFPPATSAEAGQIDGLMRFMMFIGGAIFLLVQGLLLWAVIFYRKRAGDETDGPNWHGNFTLEAIWTAIPAVIVFVLSIYSYIVYVDTRAVVEDELVVQVNGQRYAFGFVYEVPNPEAPGETITINDSVLRTYVGRPVRLQMNATDVIHSFWMPTMRVKQDMLPGRTTELRFTPTVAGNYPVVCTELCGGGHAAMYAQVYVYTSEEEYLGWQETRVNCELNPPEDPVIRGQQILASGTYPCASCHVLDALGWQGIVGPSLNGIGARAEERAGAAGYASGADYIYNSIRNPNAYIVPGYQAAMPAFGEDQMSEEQLQAIVIYLLEQGGTDGPRPGEEEALAACPVDDRYFTDINWGEYQRQ